MIPPWPFQQDDTNDSGPTQIPIHLLRYILRYANKLDTMGGAGGEADFYMVPRPCLWPPRQRMNSAFYGKNVNTCFETRLTSTLIIRYYMTPDLEG